MNCYRFCARDLHFYSRFAKLRGWFAVCLTTFALLTGTAHAVVFSFDYSGDSPGEGFNDPALGASRRAALQYAGDIWGDLIRPSYVNEYILVRAVYDPLADLTSTTLASASASGFVQNFGSSSPQYRADTQFPQALANHLYSSDSLPNVTDINIRFNANVGVMGTLSNRSWYYGTDGVLPPDTPTALYRDFVTVALHEIGHGLGFDDSFRQDGSYGVFADKTFDPAEEISGSLKIYDSFITVGPSTPLVNLNQSGRAAALVGNNLFWNGANGIAGNAGSPPQLNAPATYSGGSSTSHLDATVYSAELMNPFINGVDHTPSAMERGMLRDMGWTISLAASNVLWTGAGPDNAASTAANWSPDLPMPGDNLVFGNSPRTDIDFELEIRSADSLTFLSTAPAYTIRLPHSSLKVNGVGISNSSGQPQSFEVGEQFYPAMQDSDGALTFNNAANAGNAGFTAHSGVAHREVPLSGLPIVLRSTAGLVVFNDTASAGSGSFRTTGGVGNGAGGGRVQFHGSARAEAATFTNEGGRLGDSFPAGVLVDGFGGQTEFFESASAGTAHFTNNGEAGRDGSAGSTIFHQNSTAANGVFVNNGGASEYSLGGQTFFADNATAANSNITNRGGTAIFRYGGQTIFRGTSTAALATISNEGPSGQYAFVGKTLFFDSASAGSAAITNLASTGGPTTTDFYGTSTAANATIINKSGPYATLAGITTFHDSSTAGSGTFINDSALSGGNGEFVFKDSSSAGQGTFTNGPFGGFVTFNDHSTGGQANFILRSPAGARVTFQGSSTAGDAHFDVGPVTFGPTNEYNDLNFYTGSTAGNSTITVRGDGGRVILAGATAGNALINVLGSTRPGNISGTQAGQALFDSGSTAGSATITAQPSPVAGAPGGLIQFQNGGHAGSATLIANGGASAVNGGLIRFGSAATGDSARFVVGVGAAADFSLNAPHGGTSVGSIEGAGSFYLGASLLTVGNRNTSTTVSGVISDVGGYTAGTGGKLTKVGSGALTLGGVNTYTGLTTVAAGTLIVNGSIAGNPLVKNGGTLKGTGSMGIPTIEAGGVFAPGTSPGTITVSGLNLMSGATLQYELGATRDHIVVIDNGSIMLGGLLDLSILAGFNPAAGQTFQLFEGAIAGITGAFSSVNAPIFNGHTLNLVYGANQVTLQVIDAILPSGDYNGNGTVDAADYVVWRKGLGTTHTQDDYNLWRAHFGEAGGSGTGAAANVAVPEPTTLILLPVVIVAMYAARRRKKVSISVVRGTC